MLRDEQFSKARQICLVQVCWDLPADSHFRPLDRKDRLAIGICSEPSRHTHDCLTGVSDRVVQGGRRLSKLRSDAQIHGRKRSNGLEARFDETKPLQSLVSRCLRKVSREQWFE